MNIMSESNVLDIIVGASSMTGSGLTKRIISESSKHTIGVFTGTKGINYLCEKNIYECPNGLNLSTDGINSSQKVFDTIRGLVSELIGFENDPELVNLSLHAMAISGIDPDYPNKLFKIIRKLFPISEITITLIGYNSQDSNFPYGAKDMKNNHVNSLLSIQDPQTTVKNFDYLCFDSPSSKPLGFTFIGLFLELINYLNHDEFNQYSKELKQIIYEFIGTENYEYITDFLKEYPLRGELKDGQKKYKDLSTSDFQELIARFTKNVNCAKLSYISGDITNLYLYLCTNYIYDITSKLKDIKDNRIQLNWENIMPTGCHMMISILIDNIKIKTKQKQTDYCKNGIFDIIFESSTELIYQINPEKLDVLGDHFGIVSLALLWDSIERSTLIDHSKERILSGNGNSKIYCGNQLRLIRNENEIRVINNKHKELLATFKLTDITTSEQDTTVDITSLIPILSINEKQINGSHILHGTDWIERFTQNIPGTFKDIYTFGTARLIEWLGFMLYNILNNESILSNINFKGQPTEQDIKSCNGIFKKIELKYKHPQLDSKLNNGEFFLRINNAEFKKRAGLFIVDLEIFLKGSDNKYEKLSEFIIRFI